MEKLIITNAQELDSLIQSSVQKALAGFQPGKANEDPAFLNLNEASEFLNLANQTVYGLTSKREIPFFKRGKKLYFRESDLVAWLEKGRNRSQDEIAEEKQNFIQNRKGGKNA